MTSKRKLSREEKKYRRLKELQKASARVDTRIVLRKPDEPPEKKEVTYNDAGSYNLPISEIKKDLNKNLLFTFFAIALVVTLKITGYGFEQTKHLLNL
jgi:hypothetical protein